MNSNQFISISFARSTREEVEIRSKEVHDFLPFKVNAAAMPSREYELLGGLEHKVVYMVQVAPVIKAGIEYSVKHFLDFFYETYKKDSNSMISIKKDQKSNTERILPANSGVRMIAAFDKLAQPLIAQRSGFKESLFTLLGRDQQAQVLSQLCKYLDDNNKMKENSHLLEDGINLLAELSYFKEMPLHNSPAAQTADELKVINTRANRIYILINKAIKKEL